MATAPPLLSIDEYLHTSYHPDVHFVYGEIEERNVGEYSHNQTQGLIYLLFTLMQDQWGVDGVIEQRIRIDSSQVRVCDVAVLRLDTPHEEVATIPPLICIEVLSPEDRPNRVTNVLADYLALGVPNIWLIDPIHRTAHTFDSNGLKTVESKHLTVPGTPIDVDLLDLFAKLDKKIGLHPRS
jgi:Uma2 family endonuclease